MFRNVGSVIKAIAVIFTVIVILMLVLCAIAGAILLITGHIGDLSLKTLLIGVIFGVVAVLFSLMLYGFGHIIEMNEEQTVLLRKIAEDPVTSYEKSNNVFVE